MKALKITSERRGIYWPLGVATKAWAHSPDSGTVVERFRLLVEKSSPVDDVYFHNNLGQTKLSVMSSTSEMLASGAAAIARHHLGASKVFSH